MKVLIIEDDRGLSQSISTYLKLNGYLCELAYNLIEAQDKLATSEYDCILVDIGMPDGSGLDLIKKIKSKESFAGSDKIT